MKTIIQSLKTIVLASVIGLGVAYAMAWTGPTQPPPSGNVPAPINTSSSAQAKSGIFETYNDTYLSTLGGKVGIGTANPAANLQIADKGASDDSRPKLQIGNGTPYGGAAGLHATVDIIANDGSRAFEIFDDNNLNRPLFTVKRNGNVGIGFITPGRKLSVNGSAYVGDNLYVRGGVSGSHGAKNCYWTNPYSGCSQSCPNGYYVKAIELGQWLGCGSSRLSPRAYCCKF